MEHLKFRARVRPLDENCQIPEGLYENSKWIQTGNNGSGETPVRKYKPHALGKNGSVLFVEVAGVTPHSAVAQGPLINVKVS